MKYNVHTTELPSGEGNLTQELIRIGRESRSRIINRAAGQRVRSYPGGQTLLPPVVVMATSGSVVNANPPVWR